jgi:predicted ATP-dependent endonuclease of OLD family
MQLNLIEIEGFRSVREKLSLFVEPSVTVILGPNDHGKTNLLAAISFLNEEKKFDAETDLNWDLEGQGDQFPSLRFQFSLTDPERQELCDLENKLRTEERETKSETAAATSAEAPQANEEIRSIAPIVLKDIAPTAEFHRQGVASTLTLNGWDDFYEDVITKLRSYLPRAEIIKPYDHISDTVTAEELAADKNEFMRGIFYYGGLDPDNADNLFIQNDTTERTLQKASEKLDETLKKSWSQGEALRFHLNHHSKTDAIQLKIDDPAVLRRRVRASQRSAGFTNYFAIKTILHARQQEHRAASYLLLFDEPGLYLHPSGQFDLLQVLETLANTDQVIYVTHSLFLINKSHPARHRLILKAKKGTVIEGKPFVSRWGSVLNTLGLSLSGTILFANEVLLTEGDSDPLYIQACFQRMIAEGKVNAEINGFSALATSDGRNADVMLRILSDSKPTPNIMILFDGDKGGKEREAYLKELVEQAKAASYRLDAELTIEDYLPGGDDLYASAVAGYLAKLPAAHETEVNVDLAEKAGKALKAWRAGGNKNVSVSVWVEEFAKASADLKSGPSKVGIAREYVALLETVPIGKLDKTASKRCIRLLEQIAKGLQIPHQAPALQRIFAATEET